MARARVLLLAAFAALVAFVLPGLRTLGNDDDVLAFLPPDHPDVVGFLDVAERFGMLEVALIGVEPEEGAAIDPTHVDDLRGLVRALGDLPGVRIALSFPGLPHPVVHEDGLEVAPLVPEAWTDPDAIAQRVLHDSRDAPGTFVSRDGRVAAILVFLLPRDRGKTSAASERGRVLSDIREVTEARWRGRAYFGGAPFVEHTAASASRGDIERLSPAVIGVLFLASALLLRSLVAALLNLVLTGAGVGLVLGAHGRLGVDLTIVSSSMPVMMVALGGAFGVHILAGFQRQSGSSLERAEATLRELWWPVTLSALTTAVAFFALVVMPQAPMQRFGVSAGCSMLLLLALALGVLPALLSYVPGTWIPTRPEPAPVRVPAAPPWLLIVAVVLGGAGATRLRADPDTNKVFDPQSEPAMSAAFFDEHFEGATYLQVAIETPLDQAGAVRRIRDLGEALAAVDGVVTVRSVVEPMSLLNEAMGGRKGIPETSARAARVLTYLIGHPAMAQLMSDKADRALLHVKLAPASGEHMVAIATALRAVVAAHDGPVRVAPTSLADVAQRQRGDVAARVSRLSGRPIEETALTAAAGGASPELLAEVARLRDEILDAEDGAVAVEIPDAERLALAPERLLGARGDELTAVLTEALPTLARDDPDGLAAVSKHLGTWIDDAIVKLGAGGRCTALGFDDAACRDLAGALSEVDDEQWFAPDDRREDVTVIPFAAVLVGQPLLGQAFAESVSTSLWQSTALSLMALVLVLLAARSVVAIVPALATVVVTLGVVSALGHPISVGTSMVTCIAMGAGVDFAIHLIFRARARSDRSGVEAVRELGPVVLVSAVQLSLAFLVLVGSTMPPLRQFGTGLSVGLVVAALGAIWTIPRLLPGVSKRS